MSRQSRSTRGRAAADVASGARAQREEHSQRSLKACAQSSSRPHHEFVQARRPGRGAQRRELRAAPLPRRRDDAAQRLRLLLGQLLVHLDGEQQVQLARHQLGHRQHSDGGPRRARRRVTRGNLAAALVVRRRARPLAAGAPPRALLVLLQHLEAGARRRRAARVGWPLGAAAADGGKGGGHGQRAGRLARRAAVVRRAGRHAAAGACQLAAPTQLHQGHAVHHDVHLREVQQDQVAS